MVECQLLPWRLCRDDQFDCVQLEHGGFVRVSCVERGLILIWTHGFEWHGRGMWAIWGNGLQYILLWIVYIWMCCYKAPLAPAPNRPNKSSKSVKSASKMGFLFSSVWNKVKFWFAQMRYLCDFKIQRNGISAVSETFHLKSFISHDKCHLTQWPTLTLGSYTKYTI